MAQDYSVEIISAARVSACLGVCIGLGVKCMTPFETLRKEGARFVLGR